MTPTSVMATDQESARLATLQSYAVLDTAPEVAFDDLVRLAVEIFGAEGGAITLVDADRCWFKAKVGLDAPQIPRDISFCGFAFTSSGVMVVPDASRDDRFRHLPLVAGPAGFRFYAGAPLRAPNGHSIGTLCVLDRRPRDPTPAQVAKLGRLAEVAMSLLDARRQQAAPAAPVAMGPGPENADALALVVEDDPAVQNFTAAALRHLGHEVFAVSNGADALLRLAELRGRVRLVVTDLAMPIMNGLELVRALRRQPNPPRVVVMSGNFDPETRTQLQGEGVTSLLGKPFSLDEFKLALGHAQALRA